MTKCYSTDESDFSHDYEGLLHHVSEEFEVGESVTYWVGDSKECTHEQFICATDIIDGATNRAYDFAGEFSESYLDDMDEEKEKDLEKLIQDWMEKNIANPAFFGVENIKEVRSVWDGENLLIGGQDDN